MMSSEKNPEVVGCDASIMKNVWEIRGREYDFKMQQETERLEKSALPTINLDWEGRLSSRQGGYKRAETRPRKRVEIQADDIWKNKEPLVASAPSRPLGSGPVGRSGFQSRSFTTPASKDKKPKDNNVAKLQLLMFINQGQPSSMVWGKSWKYNKCLPLQAEGSTLGWGENWLFAIQQPFSEAGKPWPNGPSKSNPNGLKIYRKPDDKMLRSQQLGSNPFSEMWKMSWKKYDKKQKHTSQSEENDQQFGLNVSLAESQHRNEALSSSEWRESWKATKPLEVHCTFPVDSLTNDSAITQQNKNREIMSKWEESWKFSNQQSYRKSTAPSPEWANSWSAVMGALNNHKNMDFSLKHSTNHVKSDLFYHNYEPLSCEPRYKGLYSQLGSELDYLSEWKMSWPVAKNNSKPSEEMEKVLKVSSPSMEINISAKKVEKNNQKSEAVDLRYEVLKHNILYQPKREFSQSKLFFLKYLEKRMPSPDWKDSWKIIKHQMRSERRRIRPNTLEHFRSSGECDNMRSAASEWKDSWKSPRQSHCQVPDMWHQEWPTIPQIRVNRARDQEHFEPVERPKNGPSGEPGWEQSWRFSRRRPGSQPQSAEQMRQGMLRMTPRNPEIRIRNDMRSATDWQPAWMVSEMQFHHDNPAFIQWREAWRYSIYRTGHWSELETTENCINELMEIQPTQERLPMQGAKARMSRSFEQQKFRERYPEKEWHPSWSARSLLLHQQNNSGSSCVIGPNMSCSNGEKENDSRWGRSFRLANPMPHMEQQWVTLSCPSAAHYSIMWAKVNKTQFNVTLNFSNNPATFRLWVNSCCFLQSSRSRTSKPSDPRVIIPRMTKNREHLYSPTLNEKQMERKYAGCHLLGKTQPKKKPNSEKKFICEDNNEDKFFEEWVESWKFLVSSNGLKRQKSFKSLSGWNDSWKFLIPQYQPMKNQRARGH